MINNDYTFRYFGDILIITFLAFGDSKVKSFGKVLEALKSCRTSKGVPSHLVGF